MLVKAVNIGEYGYMPFSFDCVKSVYSGGIYMKFAVFLRSDNKPELIEYLAPQVGTIVDGIIKGTEQRLSRAIFKLAVEVGVQTHMLAAINDIAIKNKLR